MQRRSFLGAMLATATAPAFIPSGIERGILMPPRKIWTPPLEGIITKAGRIQLLDATGMLLGVIPLEAAGPARGGSINLTGQGLMEVSGTVANAQYVGDIGVFPIELSLNTRQIVAGSPIVIPSLQISMGRKP